MDIVDSLIVARKLLKIVRISDKLPNFELSYLVPLSFRVIFHCFDDVECQRTRM